MSLEKVDIVVTERGSKIVRRKISSIGTAAGKSQGSVSLLKRTLGSLARSRGPVTATRDIIRLNSAAKKSTPIVASLKRSFSGLRGTLATLGIALVVGETVRMIDSYTELQNRLRIVTNGQEDLKNVTAQLFDVSNRTRSSFEGTANIYARLSISAKNLGINQKDLLGFTETLNQAIVLSGASAKEAQAALIQLSQGMASNTLRGDELRSVLEQLPVVADIISTHLGITRGELREFGKEGKISAQVVVDAMKEAGPRINEAFGTTIPTISQSFVVLRNNVSELLNKFNEATGLSEAFSRAIIFLAENMDIILPIVASLVFIVGTSLAVVAIPALVTAVGTLIASMGALTVAFLSNPLTLIPALIALAVVSLYQFDTAWKVVTALIKLYFTSMVDSIKIVWMSVVILWKEGVNKFQEYWEKGVASVQGIIEFFKNFMAKSSEFVKNLWLKVPLGMRNAVSSVMAQIRDVVNFVIRLINRLLKLLFKAIKLKEILAGTSSKSNSNAFGNNGKGNPGSKGNTGSSAGSGREGSFKQSNNFTQKNNFGGPNQGRVDPGFGATASFPGRDNGLRGTFKSPVNTFSDLSRNSGNVAPLSAGGSDNGLVNIINPFPPDRRLAGGGSIKIGGTAGVDRNTLSINDRAVAQVSRGETIEVIPNNKRNESQRANVTHITMHIVTPDAESFNQSSGQVEAGIMAAQQRANARNN